jgi:hypothetical protein
MSATHTPGPWSYGCTDKRHKEFAIMAEGGKVGAVFAGFGAHFDWEQSEANARLMAASPELLAALKGLEQTLRIAAHGTGSASQADWRDFARAHADACRDAVAKAEGGQ